MALEWSQGAGSLEGRAEAVQGGGVAATPEPDPYDAEEGLKEWAALTKRFPSLTWADYRDMPARVYLELQNILYHEGLAEVVRAYIDHLERAIREAEAEASRSSPLYLG